MHPVSSCLSQYVIRGASHIATHSNSLEKAAKIAYRVIDLFAILRGISAPYLLLSSHIKDLVLLIESTRFFVIAPPLFFRDQNGQSFLNRHHWIRSAEKISITTHTALKTAQGAERSDLLYLGSVAAYQVANVPLFRWAVEGTILLFYFFGAWESSMIIHQTIDSNLIHKKKEETTQDHSHISLRTFNSDTEPSTKDLSKKKIVKADMRMDETAAWMKIAACLSKIVLILLALTCAIYQVTTVSAQVAILSLGVLSDSIGLTRIFYLEFHH